MSAEPLTDRDLIDLLGELREAKRCHVAPSRGDFDVIAERMVFQRVPALLDHIALLAERVSTLEGVVAAAKECVILEYDPARTLTENAEMTRRAKAFYDALAGLGADPATQDKATAGGTADAVPVVGRCDCGHTAAEHPRWKSANCCTVCPCDFYTEPPATPSSAVSGSPVVSGEETPDA